MSDKVVHLPVLSRIRIKNYELYPGLDPNHQEFDWDFRQGVTVIVGINGLGKTTLLKLILHTILGQRSLQQGDIDNLGSSAKFELTKAKPITMFARRVNDGAASGEVTLEYEINGTNVVVKRALRNMELLECRAGKRHLPVSEDEYLAVVSELMGVVDGYEFQVVVRSLLFFLEDRAPLLWRREAQFELFRILFLGGQLAARMRADRAKVLQKDTEMRNLRAAISRLESRLGGVISSDSDDISEQIEKLQLAVAQLAAVKEEVADMQAALDEALDEVSEYENDLVRIAIEISEKELQIQREHDGYIQAVMPKLPATAMHVFYNLLDGSGCHVCGSESERIRERWESILLAGECPVCHSPESEHEKPVNSGGRQLLQGLFDEMDSLRTRREYLEKEINRLREESSRIKRAIDDKEAELADKEKLAPANFQGNLQDLRRTAEMFISQRHQINALKEELRQVSNSYRKLAVESMPPISTYYERVKESFSKYAEAFLAEDVSLDFREEKIKLGQQAGYVKLPSFTAEMTSGTSKALLRRESVDEVSESQKEFLDLAFRMALIEAIGAQSAAMIIETPEASLDSIFISHAGDLLREFSSSAGGGRRQVIASSNLTGNEMIPALLGRVEEQKTRAFQNDTSGRVINLLKIAAKSAALRKNEAKYAQLFKAATGEES